MLKNNHGQKIMESILNPQQQEFLKNFLDPKSETFGNYLQSALKAGYSQEYSETISYQMPKWLNEALEDSQIVRKALDNLSEFLGDRENNAIRADLTKFTLKNLNSGKFGEKNEIQHRGLNINFDSSFKKDANSTR